jgi:hypothetical protein
MRPMKEFKKEFKTFISDKNCYLPVNYKFLSVITCNCDFKTFISNKKCHLHINYKFLSIITTGSQNRDMCATHGCCQSWLSLIMKVYTKLQFIRCRD